MNTGRAALPEGWGAQRLSCHAYRQVHESHRYIPVSESWQTLTRKQPDLWRSAIWAGLPSSWMNAIRCTQARL